MTGIFNTPNFILFSKYTLLYHIPVVFHRLPLCQNFFPSCSPGKLLFLFEDLAPVLRFHLKNKQGWAWWLMPVIPALWEAKVGGLLEARSLRPAWPTKQDPCF